MHLDPVVIALIGTIMGPVGLKVIEHYLSKSRIKNDDAVQIRNELRIEINTQREEIKQLEADVVKWREEYYDLRDKYIELQTQLTLALEKIRNEADTATALAEDIQQKPPETPPISI